MEKFIAEFINETNESLSNLDNLLLQLEENPERLDLVSNIFRVMHTIKGTSRFLNLKRLGHLAHKTEDLLGLFQKGLILPAREDISIILESLDQIKSLLAGLEETGKEPETDTSDLIDRLEVLHLLRAPKNLEAAAQNAADNTAASPAASNLPQDNIRTIHSLRVNVDVLEELMTLVSELVLTRNQLVQVERDERDSGFSAPLQRLNRIVSDLQEGVMKTRMQPIGDAWSKLPRTVRDISNDLGKKIQLEMIGESTELDRQVLEMIRDPLLHMVRNSADHGIETPKDRLAAGKPETGKIRLNSFHEGGHIIIEVSDDGRGLPIEKIKRKIIEHGYASHEEISSMSDQAIQQYIFLPGFSTANEISPVSGRGVGMDVVKSNIERIGGYVEMRSSPGQGVSFTIKIPLTLAIISALIMGVGGEKFAISQLDVRELLTVNPSGPNRIETINSTPVLRLREKILPLINLRKLFRYEESDAETKYIAVINSGSITFGLIIDQVFDTEEIVVKPVSPLLSNAFFSGNTILGDGQVIMILESSGILKEAGLSDESPIFNDTQKTIDIQKSEINLLLFGLEKTIKAVPLQQVARLEEVDRSKLEYASGKCIMQYGDTLIPIIFSDASQNHKHGKASIIVFNTQNGKSGFLVDHILDITTFEGDYQFKSKGFVSGSAIIKGKTVDILDLTYAVDSNKSSIQAISEQLFSAKEQSHANYR